MKTFFLILFSFFLMIGVQAALPAPVEKGIVKKEICVKDAAVCNATVANLVCEFDLKSFVFNYSEFKPGSDHPLQFYKGEIKYKKPGKLISGERYFKRQCSLAPEPYWITFSKYDPWFKRLYGGRPAEGLTTLIHT